MKYIYNILQSIRRVAETAHLISVDNLSFDYQGQAASDSIKAALLSNDPCMICRFGALELNVALRYLNSQKDGNFLVKSKRYLLGEAGPFWYDDNIKKQMKEGGGFFPITENNLNKFSKMLMEESKNIDILGSWITGEKQIQENFSKAKIITLRDIEPYYHENPWTTALKNKKVLVIHPFEYTIKKQYEYREKLFEDARVLPDFKLLTYKPVYILTGESTRYNSWFEALEKMKNDIEKIDFDIAIIAAGPYGFFLASHVKQMGKKAVHLGGATQLLFGIKGKRWEERPFFQSLFNEFWVKADEKEKPKGYQKVESGCYW